MTNSGTTSKRVAERFGFEFCTSTESDILQNPAVNTVFIATRHDSHGRYVAECLRARKHVFVEKPLCLTLEDLADIKAVLCPQHSLVRHSFSEGGTLNSSLMVGFNRRFAPLAIDLKKCLGGCPVSMIYRVNAGSIPPESWIQDPTIGGGRLVGEVCHFIDFMTFVCGALPCVVYASSLPDPQHLNDTLAINLEFSNGSVGTISYFANGAKSLDKEYFEAYSGGTTAILRDFRELEVHGRGRPFRRKLWSQDKGQAQMVQRFLEAVRDGGDPPIPFQELFSVSLATFAAQRSLAERAPVRLNCFG